MKKTIEKILKSGVNVVRLNFSWGTLEEHAHYIHTVREVAIDLGIRVPIIQDLPGPRVQNSKDHTFEETEEILTKKDLELLDFGVEYKVDYVAMSFVRNGSDISDLKEAMQARGANIPIIAKVERRKALKNIDSILDQAEAIMVARGDLGNNISLEKVPFAQHRLIKACRRRRKPVIVATQMLYSMRENSEPTRAEVSDVAYAVMDGADAIMLSGETAIGKYPVETVKIMEAVAREAENHAHHTVHEL